MEINKEILGKEYIIVGEGCDIFANDKLNEFFYGVIKKNNKEKSYCACITEIDGKRIGVKCACEVDCNIITVSELEVIEFN